jgi:hypothetical protein
MNTQESAVNMFFDDIHDLYYIVFFLVAFAAYFVISHKIPIFRGLQIALVYVWNVISTILLIRDGPALKETAVIIVIAGTILMNLLLIFLHSWERVKLTLPGGTTLEGEINTTLSNKKKKH